MFQRFSLPALLLGSLLLSSVGAHAAAPTLHEVYQTVQAGRLDEADRMMEQVLKEHPDSAKAHFVESEILVKEGRLEGARAELSRAEGLDGSLSFAKPASVAELRQKLAASVHESRQTPAFGGNAPASSPYATQAPYGSIWPWLLGLLALFAIVRLVRGMRPPATPYQSGLPVPGSYPPGTPPGYGGPGYGPGPGYAGPGMAGGMGSGLMGNLATGAALGAGLVAGEALMHRVIDGPGRERDAGFIPNADAAPLQQDERNYDVGGSDFGVNDAGSWDNSGGGGDDSW